MQWHFTHFLLQHRQWNCFESTATQSQGLTLHHLTFLLLTHEQYNYSQTLTLFMLHK